MLPLLEKIAINFIFIYMKFLKQVKVSLQIQISFLDNTYLAIDWKPKWKKLHFDEDADEVCSCLVCLLL